MTLSINTNMDPFNIQQQSRVNSTKDAESGSNVPEKTRAKSQEPDVINDIGKGKVANTQPGSYSEEASIKDADMAAKSMSLIKEQMLQQGDVAMLAQANNDPQRVLQLLGV